MSEYDKLLLELVGRAAVKLHALHEQYRGEGFLRLPTDLLRAQRDLQRAIEALPQYLRDEVVQSASRRPGVLPNEAECISPECGCGLPKARRTG
jgi:hypothetical protein